MPAEPYDMLAVLAGDASLPGAALLRRAAYERMMINWLDEVLRRINVAREDDLGAV